MSAGPLSRRRGLWKCGLWIEQLPAEKVDMWIRVRSMIGLPSYQLVHLRSLPFNYSYRLELLVVVVGVAAFRSLGVEIYALGSVCCEIRLAHTLWTYARKEQALKN